MSAGTVAGPLSTTPFIPQAIFDVGDAPFTKTVNLLEQTEQIRQSFETNLNALKDRVDALIATVDVRAEELRAEEIQLNVELFERRQEIGSQQWFQTQEGIQGLETLNKLYPSVETIPPLASVVANFEQIPEKLTKFKTALTSQVYPPEDSTAQTESIQRLNKLNDTLVKLNQTQTLKNELITTLATPLGNLSKIDFTAVPPDSLAILNVLEAPVISVSKSDLEDEAADLGYPVLVTLSDGSKPEFSDWEQLSAKLADLDDPVPIQKALHIDLTQTLEDANTNAANYLKTAIANTTASGLGQRQDQKFLASSSVVYLYSFILLSLNKSQSQIERLKLSLARDYVDFLQYFSKAKEEARQRLEANVNQLKGLSVQQAVKRPRWQEVHDQIKQLGEELRQLIEYNQLAPQVLTEIMEQDYILEITNLQNKLTNLNETFQQLAAGFSEEWPELDTENFNQKIVQRMLNPDIDLSKAKSVPDGARMTVSSVADQIFLAGSDVATPRVDTADLEQGTCGGPIVDRDYQLFLGDYLFAKGSDYKGILANWGVGTGKTRASILAIDKAIKRWDAKVKALWDKSPRENPDPADLSNYIQIWVPSEAIISDTWIPDLKKFFQNRDDFREIPTNEFTNNLDSSSPGYRFVNPPLSTPIYSHQTKNILLNDPTFTSRGITFKDASGRNRIYISLTAYDAGVGGLYWMQAPLNYILTHTPWGSAGLPADSVRVNDTLSWTTAKWQSEATNDDRAKFRSFSPFVILDEMHKLWQPSTNKTPLAKKEFRFIRNQILPYHSFSKTLGLTATPFDLLAPNFANISQIVAILKYYPDEGIDYKTEFADSSTGKLIDIDQVVVRNAEGKWEITDVEDLQSSLKIYFSGFLSYVSLNFDTTVYPYFNANICNAPPGKRGGFKLCVAPDTQIKAATSEADIVAAFADLPPDRVYGNPKDQAKIRQERQWKYTVPNLVQVLIDDSKQIEHYNAWFKNLKDVSDKHPFRKARLYDQNTFDDEEFDTTASGLPVITRIDEKPISEKVVSADKVAEPPKDWTAVNNTITKAFLANDIIAAQKLWNDVSRTYPHSKRQFTPEQLKAYLNPPPKAEALKDCSNVKLTPNELQDCIGRQLTPEELAVWGRDLTPNELDEQAFLDVVGVIGPKITFTKPTTKGEPWAKSLEVLSRVKQEFLVGSKFAAYEKGLTCAALLKALKDSTGKVIFIQTSYSGEDIPIDYFWDHYAWPYGATVPPPQDIEYVKSTFFQGIRDAKGIEIFDYVPYVAGTDASAAPVPDNWNIGAEAYWYERPGMKVPANQLKNDNLLKITKDAEAKEKFVKDSVETWYTTHLADKQIRIIYLGNRLYGADSFPVVEIVKDFWRGLLNHRLNWNGDYFKGVCLTPSSTEGVSILDVRYHVNVNPPQRLSVKEQGEGRGFRQCSLGNISWHHTQVVAEPNAATPTNYRIATSYTVTGETPKDNVGGIFPEIYVMTLIATFEPGSASAASSLIKKTPDEIAADWIYRDPDAMGDAFLRFLQTLAVDNGLFGQYSGLQVVGGTLAQDVDWSLAQELVYQAVSQLWNAWDKSKPAGYFSSGDPSELNKLNELADYVEKFYRIIPWDIYENAASSITPWENFQNRTLDLVKTALTDFTTPPAGQTPGATRNLLNDLYAKLIWFLMRNSELAEPPSVGVGGFSGLAEQALYLLRIRQRPDPSVAKPPYELPQFKIWLDALSSRRAEVEKTKGLNITKPKGLAAQSETIIEMSTANMQQEESLLTASLLAQHTTDKAILPPSDYYAKYVEHLFDTGSLTTPIPAPKEWLTKAVRANLEQPGAYYTKYPIF